jgi:DNA polymerase-3 subunit delta'
MPLADLVGQARAVGRLRRALASGRFPHALCFGGPPGVGKRTAAVAVAQALNCDAAGDDACGACRPCRKVAAGLHPDVKVIAPKEAWLKVDEVREAFADLAFHPYEGRRKVYVLDQADRLTPEAESALLKTLEEPPARNAIILIAARPQALLPPVRSRCQLVRFAPVPTEAAARHLAGARGLDAETARALAAWAGGSLGRALEADDARAVLDARDEAVQGALRAVDGDGAALVALAEAWDRRGREGVLEALEQLAAWLRDLLVLRVPGSEELVANWDRRVELARRAAASSRPALLAAARHVGAAQERIRRNANCRLALEVLFLDLRQALTLTERNEPWRPLFAPA